MNSKTQFNLLTLGASFIIFFFSIISAIFAWLASYLIILSGVKGWFLGQTRIINIIISGVMVFLIMSGVVFWVDSFLVDLYNFLVEKFGKFFLSVLTVSTLVVLLIALYFTLPIFLVTLRNQFWL